MRQLLTFALLGAVSAACTSSTAKIGSGGSGGSGGGGGIGGTAGGAGGTAGSIGPGGATGDAGIAGTTGAAGTTTDAGADGTTTDAGTAGTGSVTATGRSVGCGMTPAPGESSTASVVREVHINGLDPVYLPGGSVYANNQIANQMPYDYTFRPYGLRLPKNYDPATAYPVTIGGAGCGSLAKSFTGGPGFPIDTSGSTIQVSLASLSACFDDGGPNIDDRPDTPELPYFRAVLADVEAHTCVDKSKVFVSGYSSGAFEAYTLGCAAADVIRGIGAYDGGMRKVRPPCTGPVAAVLVAETANPEDPVGPLDPKNAMDAVVIGQTASLGSAAARDDLLERNGCVGDATTAVGVFDPKFPLCVSYTGCPAAYPVIWCQIPGLGRNPSIAPGGSYRPGPMWQLLGSLPAP